MNPRPRAEDYPTPELYRQALELWEYTEDVMPNQAEQAGAVLNAAAIQRARDNMFRVYANEIPVQEMPRFARAVPRGVGFFVDEAEQLPAEPVDMDKLPLKERHLNKRERDQLHKPKSDWCESNKGDVCRSACTLDVSDLITKVR